MVTTTTLVQYSPEVTTLLEDFATSPEGSEIPPPLNEIIANIAKTGVVCYPWQFLKILVTRKCVQNLEHLVSVYGWKPLDPATEVYEKRIADLVQALDSFIEPPFTLQRLCELLTDPSTYTRSRCYMYALEKMASITTTLPTLSPEQVTELNAQLIGTQESIQQPTSLSTSYSNPDISHDPDAMEI